MATKRKQQTIQFLFEASPENNITRCLISTTSNTFENGEGRNASREVSFEKEPDEARHADHIIERRGCQPFSISVETNGEEKKDSEQFPSGRREMDSHKVAELNDFDEKRENSCKEILNKKENSLGRTRTEFNIANLTCGDRRDSNTKYTIPGSEDMANEDERYSSKNTNRFNLKDKNKGIQNDSIHTNYQAKSFEVHPNQDTEINNSFDNYKYYSNYHNMSSQNTQANPEGKESRDLFPLLGDSKNIETNDGGENSTLENIYRNKEHPVFGKFGATTYEGNESKYLHIIDYDIQEPPPVIKSFKNSDHSTAEEQVKNPSKIEDIEKSESLGEINNNTERTFHEAGSKHSLDYKSKIQLPDLLNPQRLHGRQIKEKASLQSDNDIDGGNQFTLQKACPITKQSEGKVRNLVHEYELQVLNEDHPRQDEKSGNQSILLPKSKNAAVKLYDHKNQSKSKECCATYVRPLNIEKPSDLEKPYNSGMDKPVDSYNNSNSHSKAMESKNISLSSSSSVERSPDSSTTSAFTPLVKAQRLADSDDENRSVTRSFPLNNEKLGLKYEQHTSRSSSRVIKAHWYDIQSTSRQSSKAVLQPSRLRKWKSLGELDRMEQAEEYELPEHLSKTETCVPEEYLESDFTSRFEAKRNNQTLSSGLHANSPSIGLATKTKSPFLSRKYENPAGHTQQEDNSSYSSSSFHRTKEHGNLSSYRSTQCKPDQSPMKRSPFLRRKHEEGRNSANVGNTSGTSSLFQKTSNNAPLSSSPSSWGTSDQGDVKQSPSSEIDKKDNTSSFSSLFQNISGNGNLNSFSTNLVQPSESSVLRASAPRKKYENPNEAIPSDSFLFHPITDQNNNLSSSMTVLETLDQSPMRRSQKMKNLLNIEYYDINSDDELNSKIKRRPRTKSLNDQDRETVANVPARREFRSSEDLTRSGRANQEEVNRVSRDEEQAWRTNTNYENFDVTSAANNSSSKGHSKPTYAAKLVSHDKEKLDEYQRHSQVQVPMYNTRNVHTSLKPNTAITVNSNTKGLNSHERYSKRQLGRDKGITVREIEKGNDLSGYSTNNTRPKESKIDGLKQYRKDMNTVSTLKQNVKKLPSTLYKSKDKAGKGHAHHKESSKDNKESKSTIYPNEDFKASEGKYNIAKAEEEWKKRYGRLPYNEKDPLHQSSDKDFSILFKNTVDECATQNSTGQRGLSKKRFSLEEAIRNTSTSSLFSPNNSVNEKSSNSIARNSDDISTTLHQLSSYVISGYKDDSKENSNHISSQGDQETKAAVAVRYRRYYLDDEGDLSHILDNTTESRKLSMLVHCIIRLREVYSIQPIPMSPQMEEHPMNLGNPQLRDAIQSKPMKVVKDIILANKSVDINTCSQSGDSALHRAAIEGDIDAIRIIINQGGNVNIRDRNGFQPVHQALSYHHYKAAMFLMDCGVDLMSYTSKRIQQFARVRAIARQYLRQTLKTPL